MHVIGLSGKIGSGKSTVAEELERIIGNSVVRLSFGDELKRTVAKVYSFDPKWAYSQEGKNRYCLRPNRPLIDYNPDAVPTADCTVTRITIREALQEYGSKMREENIDYWVEKLHRRMREVADGWREPTAPIFIIDDVRHVNEADFVLKDMGGSLFKIVPHEAWNPSAFAQHESETALDYYPNFTNVVKNVYGDVHSTAQFIVHTDAHRRYTENDCMNCIRLYSHSYCQWCIGRGHYIPGGMVIAPKPTTATETRMVEITHPCPEMLQPSQQCAEAHCCMSCRYVNLMGDQFPCGQCRSVCDETNHDGFHSRCMYTKE